MKVPNYIIFTDLDGTLLDHDNYSFSDAVPAIKKIKKHKIPLILSSSKTRVEMVKLQAKLGIEEYPFIVENGSAFYTSSSNFPFLEQGEKAGTYTRFLLGSTYKDILQALNLISKKYGYKINGFHNTSKEEIIERTNLSPEAVELAIHREFSIPLFYDDRAEEILLQEIQYFKLKILYGGRFMHLLGNTDKGAAMEKIINGYKKYLNSSDFKIIAVGDTLNDVAMLKKADIAILVKRYNDQYDDRIKIENIIYSPYIGPKGWNYSILEVLSTGEKNG